MNSDSPHLRFAIVGIVTISLFAALFARLWFLQVMTSPQYEVAARNNAVRNVQQEAPRGRILDREGRVLVDNRRSIQVAVDWQAYHALEAPEQTALLARLAKTLTRFADEEAAGEPSIAPLGTNDPANGVAGSAAPPTSATTTTASTSTTTTTPLTEGAVDGANPPLVPNKAEPVTVEKLRKRLDDARFSHFEPVPVATDVSEPLEIYLVEHAEEYPTVQARRVTVRQYHYGTLLAHVLGYVGQADPADLKEFQNSQKHYEQSDEVGKSGIERAMESQLRGVPGLQRIEVDARNKPVREIEERPPVPGNDVYLSVDISLQYLVEKKLAAQIGTPGRCTRAGCPQARTGAAVVTDPRNGQVLAMASYPTYDPSLFTGGISTVDYNSLVSKDNGEPLLNRAIGGTYAPGSTWKLFTAYSGLENQQITPDEVVVDNGSYKVPKCDFGKCEFANAGKRVYGPVNLSRAITVSSDVYFYKLGDDMWRRRGAIGEDALARTYAKWGFGSRTGIGLTGEQPGLLPSPAENRKIAEAIYKGDQAAIDEHARWGSGQNMNSAIGQGLVSVTPLQLVNGYATFANGGALYVPSFVLQVLGPFSEKVVAVEKPKVKRRIELPPQWQLPMAAGFAGVTRDTYGTAAATFAGFPQSTFPVAGKTGTAQVNGKGDTSLFVAYAPADAPRFAISVVLPEGGNGGSAAAPAVRRILEPIADAGGDLTRLPQAPEGGHFDPNAPDDVVAPPSVGVD